MNELPEWARTDAPAMRNHWWWRPGWRHGRSFWTWHFTFEDATQLHGLVAAYQAELKRIATLDLVPQRWLHMTVQGLGFADEVTHETVLAVREAVAEEFRSAQPIQVRFEQAIIRPEAIAIPPTPLQPVLEAKASIRRGIAAVLGEANVPESADGFQPHVTAAYSNAESDAGAIREALDRVDHGGVNVTLSPPRLIRLNRDHRMYQWPQGLRARR